jgi:hypothetical protein
LLVASCGVGGVGVVLPLSAAGAAPAPRAIGWSCAGRASDACDVGGEEVDAMAVEVAAGAVVVFGGSRVGVAREDARRGGGRRRRGRW